MAKVELGWDNNKLRAGAAAAQRIVQGAAGGITSSFAKGAAAFGAAYGFTALIKRGFEFNQTMGDSEVAIANVIKQFQGLDDVAARAEAAKAMKAIVAMEPKTAATLQGLTEGFLATFAASQSAGVSVEQNVDLVGRLANALANANIPAEQLTQELRSIVTGNINSDSALARMLQISNEDVNKAKSAGKLYEMLVEKVGSLGDAGDTAGVAFSTLQSAIDKAAGALTAELFGQGVEGVTTLSATIEDNIETFKNFGVVLGGIGKGFRALGDFAAASTFAVGFAPVLDGSESQSVLDRYNQALDAIAQARAEAEIEAAKPFKKGGAAGTPNGSAAKASTDLKDAATETNRILEAQERFAKNLLDDYLDILPPNIKLIELKREILRLEELLQIQGPGLDLERLRIQQEILERNKEVRDVKEQIRKQEKEAAEEAKKAIRGVHERAAEAARIVKEEREAAARRSDALATLNAETAILREQAAGHDRKAKIMERELEIAKNAQRIMEETGLTQAEALRRAKEIADLEDKAERRKNGRGGQGDREDRRIHGYSQSQGNAAQAAARAQARRDEAYAEANRSRRSFGGLDEHYARQNAARGQPIVKPPAAREAPKAEANTTDGILKQLLQAVIDLGGGN